MKRTDIDFSKHEVIETHFKNDNHSLDIWDLKLPNSNYYHRVTFINSCGVLTVTGDFGRWSFCREFHPSSDGKVSDGYWSEKLQISSKQESAKYDSEKTQKEINKLIKSGLKDYGYSGTELKEAKEWFKELLSYTEDEFEYIYQAYRDSSKPSFLDHELIPFCKTRHFWLSVIYDAFDELCKRSSKKNITKKSGIEIIAEERKRQIEVEGWTPEHDAQHDTDDLAHAAAAYASAELYRRTTSEGYDNTPHIWPFERKWWKPTPENRVRELVKAGALIAAEIDRINNISS